MQLQYSPLITIITATYNAEKVLQNCINSVNEQTYKNFEHIIIDGASKDSTVDIIKNNLKTVKYWISEPDMGVYDAWNKGIKASSGEWVVFIGSDDVMYPGALSAYVEYLKNCDKNIQLLSSKTELINSKGIIYRTIGRPFNWKEFRRQNIIAHTGALHHKSLFSIYGLYNVNYKICGDYEFLLRAGNKLEAHYIDKVLVIMADGGISSGFAVYKEHLKAVTKIGGLNKFTAYFDYLSFNLKTFAKKQLSLFNINVYWKREYNKKVK